jgi:DNA-binding CsgD family transcriptional regulator
MSNPMHISSLIGDIYDAIRDQSQWSAVLGKAAQFVGAQAGALVWRHPVSRAGGFIRTFGIEPRYIDLYAEHYAKLDPAAAPMLLCKVGEVAGMSDLVPHDDLLRTRFYQEWMQPQGFVDAVQASLDKSPASSMHLCFMRNGESGPVDNTTRNHLRLIVPHMQRAVLVGKRVDHITAQAATFGDALDRIGAGLFFVDAGGHIVHANAGGQAMLAEGALVRTTGGKLTPCDAKAEQGLYEILRLAESTDGAIRRKAVPLAGRDGKHHVAHVLPLPAGARRRTGAGYTAVAAVFVQKTAFDMRSLQEVIARFYKLTPTELRVLFAIIQVGGVPAVAAAMGISGSTVKTHLSRLFAKTGTDRQADLVKLVASYANPLVA